MQLLLRIFFETVYSVLKNKEKAKLISQEAAGYSGQIAKKESKRNFETHF